MSVCKQLALGVVILLGLSVAVGADDEKPAAITDPAYDGADFKMQGEYVGTFSLGEGTEQKFGMQLVSIGDGKFHAIALFGGLPGDGWDGFGKLEADAEMKDGVVEVVANEGSARLKDGVVTVATNDGTQLGMLTRVERESETLGAAAPEGAVVLFDGSNVDQFDGAALTEDKLLSITEHSALSKKKFKDFSMHIEFRTPYMPTATGQARGNSGVYLQNRFEVQVLDSFGLAGLDDECGGIYKIKAPDVNMCYPPLAWQTYDIDFTAATYDEAGNKTANARLTVKHNGVVIHDNIELPNATPGGEDESAEPGAIMLQNHGNPVMYRNIWVVEKTS